MGKLVKARRNSLKTIGRVVIVSGIIASTVVVATPAQAAAETYRNAYTGNCLDGDGGGEIYPHACNGGSNQSWEVIRNSDGSRTFRNVATGLCLDNNDTQAVYGHSCNGGNYQRWWISRAYGLIGFENKQTKRCLRDVGDDIRAPRRGLATCAAASSRQRWG
ncbi:MAG: RICIN domain-containing protein [Actinobacteria bacterium]|nr:RICIN domain-containing protein [Actinomycetota bacterium]